jgi:hypothetical protein
MSIPRHELADLARICAKNAQTATSKEVASELWKMAREYRQKATELGHDRHPDVGAPPSGWAEVGFGHA